MHNKLSTDEKLMERGCCIPSMCSLCHSSVESSFHLFFECPYSIKLWCWLASILNMNLYFQAVDEIWKLCDRGWNPQWKLVIKASIINIISSIWYSRNQARFNNKTIRWESAISMIHPPRAPVIKEVYWHPPIVETTQSLPLLLVPSLLKFVEFWELLKLQLKGIGETFGLRLILHWLFMLLSLLWSFLAVFVTGGTIASFLLVIWT